MAVRKSGPRPVRKAKPTDGDWIACFDRNGTLIGICAPDAITPVSDNGDDTSTAAGTADGVTKRARRSTEHAELERQQRVTELRKGLSGPGLAAEHDQLAKAMGEAAQRVLQQIHHGRRTG